MNNILDDNGYPTTTNTNTNIESLFSGKTVNNLFSSDYYDATGYYEYSSFKNYAYLGNDSNNFKVYEELNVYDMLVRRKQQGQIRHLGFSFHDTPEALEYIIDKYPWDFVQIQLN